jgi:hypothetical protein
MIQQIPLLFAGPALAASPLSAADLNASDLEMDFSGWIDAADPLDADALAADPLLLVSQLPIAVMPPQPMPPAPRQNTESQLVALDADLQGQSPSPVPQAVLATPVSGDDSGFSAVPPPAQAVETRLDLPAAPPLASGNDLAPPKPAIGAAAEPPPPAGTAALQTSEKPLLAAVAPPVPDAPAASDPAGSPPAVGLAAPADLPAAAKPRPAVSQKAEATAAVLNAVAATVVIPAPKPQVASARSTAPTPHWSRIEAATEESPPAIDPAKALLPQPLAVDQPASAEPADGFKIEKLPQTETRVPQPDTPALAKAAAMPANLHSQLLTHAPSALQRQVEVLLAPEELGHVKFQIRHIGDSVSVFLSAERPETMDMLRRNGEDLLREFRQAGFAGASLDFGQWGQQQQPSQQPPAAFALADEFSLAPPIARPAPAMISADQAQGLNIRL